MYFRGSFFTVQALCTTSKKSIFKNYFSALFLPRQKPTSEEDAQLLKSEWAEDLESMKMFVLEGKKFIVLPEAEKGVFYSESCYAFVCRYFFAPELPEGEGMVFSLPGAPAGGLRDAAEEPSREGNRPSQVGP